jgi:hypothetical protein
MGTGKLCLEVQLRRDEEVPGKQMADSVQEEDAVGKTARVRWGRGPRTQQRVSLCPLFER